MLVCLYMWWMQPASATRERVVLVSGRRLLVGESVKLIVRGFRGQTPLSFFSSRVDYNWTSDSYEVRALWGTCM